MSEYKKDVTYRRIFKEIFDEEIIFIFKKKIKIILNKYVLKKEVF